MAGEIHALVPAEAGWRAFYTGEYPEDAESVRVVAWALVDGDEGRELVGLVVAADDPTRIVPAPEGASAVATDFARYGFKSE